ncbi:MAG: GNAT family N-acetyltransferase, partial [Actinomycetota bacterium]
LLVRRFRQDDLEAFVDYRSDPDVARLQTWETPYSRAQAELFLKNDAAIRPGQRGKWLQLAIEERATRALCGDCGIHVITEQPRTAEVGVTLASQFQGKGIATEALTASLDWLFGDLQIHRVFAQADDRNHRVQRLLDGLNFRLEGRFIEADWFKGEWTTLRIYALLREDWRR